MIHTYYMYVGSLIIIIVRKVKEEKEKKKIWRQHKRNRYDTKYYKNPLSLFLSSFQSLFNGYYVIYRPLMRSVLLPHICPIAQNVTETNDQCFLRSTVGVKLSLA